MNTGSGYRMMCRAEARERARNAIDPLEGPRGVISVDLVSPTLDPTDQWTLEIELDSDGLSTCQAGPRGCGWHAVTVVDG